MASPLKVQIIRREILVKQDIREFELRTLEVAKYN